MFPASQPAGRRKTHSSVNVVVSDAGFHAFKDQVEEAIEFLRDEDEELRRLCGWPGVEGATLDFGIAWRDVAAQSDHLPAELVRLAGSLGLALEMSHYPVGDEPPHGEAVDCAAG